MSDKRCPRHDEAAGEILRTELRGCALLCDPHYNKGTAFSHDEREAFALLGLLPAHVETLENQTARAYEEYRRQASDLQKHVFLRAIQDNNRILFYHLLQMHLEEMLPIIYTPTVGSVCRDFSHVYRRPHGLFLAYPDRHHLDTLLANTPGSRVDVIVVTDGERILGLGDQGVGGMGIPLGKLSLYTTCAGIDPATTLPILLDTGTDNADLLEDPLYMGWRHERVRGADYDAFIEQFVDAVNEKYPHALLQWEDFALHNAHRLLHRYRDRLCTFNDDIQGTAAVVLGTLLAAVKIAERPFREERVVIVGAGSAGCGIARQLVSAMIAAGDDRDYARSRIFMVDRKGLLHDGMEGELQDFQSDLAQSHERLEHWDCQNHAHITLEEVIANAKPTALIGACGQQGIFSRAMVKTMAKHIERPAIFPLSNPNQNAEATPENLVEWTDGRALIATGSPFADVDYNGRRYRIPQCNNAYIFPGVGLGVLRSQANYVSDEMFTVAAHALSECAPALNSAGDGLLPGLDRSLEVSAKVAHAVAAKACEQGFSRTGMAADALPPVEQVRWHPMYRRMEPGN